MDIINLSKVYRKHKVLDIEQLHIKEGRIYAVVGENGAGKTTLFKILAGLVVPTSGHIEFSEDKNKIGIMIEAPAIELTMSAEENLRWASKLYGEENCQDIQTILKLVNLNGIHRKAKTFSMGMKQRLGIDMSLIHKPNILILDEPMNGIDPQGMMELRKVLLEINKNGTTIILSSHILAELYKLATDYIFIKEGRIIQTNRYEDFVKGRSLRYKIVTSDNEKANTILSDKFDCITHAENNEIFFCTESENIFDMSKELAEAGVYILELSRQEFDVEAYYVEVMSKL